ncbi:MAG: NADH-quinone oxidoreductase subunit NuoN [Alphaproteobacteria bacterium]|nr:NADH-quinone oxidoreductase subunit NuoN [Alphaproteobacteria bacterium]
MDLMTDLHVALPDALLAAVGLVGLLLGAIGGDRISILMRLLSGVALAVAAVLAFQQVGQPSALAFNGLYQATPFTSFAKGVTYAMAAVALFMSGGFLKITKAERYEYSLLVVFSAMGAGVMLSAHNLITLYMGVETLSLASYVLAAFKRDSVRSAEAGLKYFVLGALASGLLLYGSSLIYGFAHGAGYDVIAQAPTSIGLTFGLVLLIVGLAFKASAAPFHVWVPDVYEGAPSTVVAYFSTAPKIAAVVVLANVMFTTFGPSQASWQGIIAIISAASMVIGAFGALAQNNIKRILAYSSISNVGFALIGVAAGEKFGASSVLVYMTIYVIATLGMFGAVLALRRNGAPLENISDLNGLAKTKPGMAFGLLMLTFSVAGIPPLAGFWGKVQVIQAGLHADMLWLVLIGLASSVVSLGYYLRIVWAVMMKPPGEALDRTDWPVATTVLATSVLMFPVLTIGIQRLLDVAVSAHVG